MQQVVHRADHGIGPVALHVARQGRRGRHFVMFRVARAPDGNVIEVLRLLHDVLDLQRHLPPAVSVPANYRDVSLR